MTKKIILNCAQNLLTNQSWLLFYSWLNSFPALAKLLQKNLRHSYAILAKYFLHGDDHEEVYCQEEHFEAWQDMLTQMSPLPLLAAHYLQKHRRVGSTEQNAENFLRNALGQGVLPHCRIWEQFAAYHAAQVQSPLHLHDFHVHFSGILQADTAWQRCIKNPHNACKDVSDKFARGSRLTSYTREQINSPIDILRRLRLARWLQETLSLLVSAQEQLPVAMQHEREKRKKISWKNWWLLCALDGYSDFWFETYFVLSKEHCVLGAPLFSSSPGSTHPLDQCKNLSTCSFTLDFAQAEQETLASEGVLWLRALHDPSPLVACMLHCYGILLSQFIRLATHQPDIHSFSAFQDAAHCGLTKAVTQHRLQFMQLNSMYKQPSGALDCRFTPQMEKKKLAEAYKLYLRALRGKEPILKHFSRLLPATPFPFQKVWLRPHFIKMADKPKDVLSDNQSTIKILKTCLHAGMRKNLERVAYNLFQSDTFTQKELPLLGIDVAGDETSCPPEVFAPVFRLLTQKKNKHDSFEHSSYHVGEVFPDLLSGIRAVDEALQFLDLSCGDRIGHGNALGMNPQWWRQGKPLATISKGALLDNYVWIWGVWNRLEALQRRMSHKEAMYTLFGQAHSEKLFLPMGDLTCLQEKIIKLSSDIYPQRLSNTISSNLPATLHKAWQMRKLDATRLNVGPATQISDWASKELILINKSKSENECAFRFFEAYQTDSSVRKYYAEKTTVDMNYIHDEALRMLQDFIILDIIKKKIIIEVMPTSNRRIVGYESYADHHVLRWICDDKHTGRPAPKIVFATDNPGVFSTTIHNEYTHIFLALKHAQNMPDSALWEVFRSIHETGNDIFRLVP